MWSLYADSNSFSIAMPFKLLKDLLAKSLSLNDDTEISEALFGMVEYLGTYKYAMKKHEKKKIASAFIKSPIFTHEQELRFMLFKTNPVSSDDRIGIRILLNESLKNYSNEIKIVSHPEMDIETHTIFKEQIKSIGFELYPSEILTKNNTNQFLVD